MVIYAGGCLGRGSPDAFCNCICHTDMEYACDDTHCAPVSAHAADNIRLKHVNRDADAGKQSTRRGRRSLRKR